MRRHGLMHPKGAARVVALILAIGVIAGFSSTYLVQAGMPGWLILLLTVLALLIPIIAATKSSKKGD
ncbi:hypothetical protein GCM10027271_30260 [Saccharopolyspora gloriosae]|uniref:Uncharacterized protein n=1 Tax=Saccharopolyspora gloriosae TaxID=455344 RepID=A0A840NGW5_9PSEU|nr:hypothetical protein [Saccharopolyspora gloriosae]MBB5071140.1 hypothetical protein [Saccharopolyspora gloriosae]